MKCSKQSEGRTDRHPRGLVLGSKRTSAIGGYRWTLTTVETRRDIQAQHLPLPGTWPAGTSISFLTCDLKEVSAPQPLLPPWTPSLARITASSYPLDSELPLLLPDGVIATRQPGQSFFKLQIG